MAHMVDTVLFIMISSIKICVISIPGLSLDMLKCKNKCLLKCLQTNRKLNTHALHFLKGIKLEKVVKTARNLDFVEAVS